MVTQERLKELVEYDPETGLFRWLVSKGKGKGMICGTLEASGYVRMWVDNKIYLAHRLAYLYMTGSIPECIDHIDRIKDNNKWDNLRGVTKSQNRMNSKKMSNNKSGIKGVYKEKKSGLWRARVVAGGKKVYDEVFQDKSSAEEAVKEARDMFHKGFSYNG